MTMQIERKQHWKVRRAKAGAAERWKLDKERRDKLAAMNPLLRAKCDPICLRVKVTRNELETSEAIVYASDSAREARRKIRCLGVI